MIRTLAAALLSTTILAAAAPAYAGESEAAAAEISAMRAEIERLTARLEAVEERAARAEAATQAAAPGAAAAPAVAAAPPGPEIRFSGAPQIRAPGGWSFKPRGRLQYDAGTVGRPDGVADRSLGFGNELRRARLGVEGTIPGGFGYAFEVDFADNNVEITDATLSYRAADPATITLGQHNGFQSLEELTSSRFSSFIERAAFTDAFNFERRLGLSATYSQGPVVAQAGLFTDNINDLGNDENDSVGLDGRLVFAPRLGETQLHLGASAHWRSNGDLDQTGVTTRYRQRPLVHFTDVRFLATPALPVESETHHGLEAALIRGPLHAAGEVHWLNADTATAGLSPTFFGGYAELGWFITGESRGYRGGKFDRTSVRRPVGGEGGGFGALQLNLRYDHLDLNSDGIRGGVQNGLQLGLTWIATDYVRFLLNYGRMNYRDAAVAAAGGDRGYSVDVVGARAQIDF